MEKKHAGNIRRMYFLELRLKVRFITNLMQDINKGCSYMVICRTILNIATKRNEKKTTTLPCKFLRKKKPAKQAFNFCSLIVFYGRAHICKVKTGFMEQFYRAYVYNRAKKDHVWKYL